MNTRPNMSNPILKVEHLSMKFGGLVAIGDLSFQAERGEITALIGPNGAGKTTVFNCITGFYKPSEGMIKLSSKTGQEFLLERMPDFQITAKAKVARTFQNIRLFSGMTLLENLLVAQHNKLMKASGYTVLGLLGIGGYAEASKESVELAKFWLEKASLIDRADDPAGDLPYGAQRRLEIARAMCTGPELLCLDEPAAGLNPKESLALNELLIDVKNSTGTSILLIEHDMSVVMQISDHVVVLEYGRKISDGAPGFVKNDPRVIAAYLGVDDEEVGDVLSEVDAVAETVNRAHDSEPDAAHGPRASSSMMAGPISDSIEHGGTADEAMKISPLASKADQITARTAKSAAKAKSSDKSKASSAKSQAASLMATPTAKSTVAKAPFAKAPVAKATATKTTGAKTAPAKASTPVASKPTVVKSAPQASPKPTAAKAVTPKAAVTKANSTKTATPVAKATSVKPTAAKPAAVKTAASAPLTGLARTVKPAKANIVTSQKIVTKAQPVKAPSPAPASASKAVVKAAAEPKKTATVGKKAGVAPVKAAPTPKASTPKTITNVLTAPRGGVADRLILIKGIGPVNEKKLNSHGIYHFDQIAAWKKADIEAAEAYLAFDGRIAREDWIGQAKTFARSAAAKPQPAKRGGRK